MKKCEKEEDASHPLFPKEPTWRLRKVDLILWVVAENLQEENETENGVLRTLAVAAPM